MAILRRNEPGIKSRNSLTRKGYGVIGRDKGLRTAHCARMAEKQLAGGEFESTISSLKADYPLEDGQMGNPG